MTDEIIGSDVNEDKTAEVLAAEEKEAEEAFGKGFKKVDGEDDTPSDDKSLDDEKIIELEAQAKTETDLKVKAKAEEDAKVKTDEEAVVKAKEKRDKFDEALPTTIDRLSGQIGGLMSKLNQTLETKKTASEEDVKPGLTKEEIQKALKDPEAMDELVKEFGEIKPVRDELLAIREEISKRGTDDTSVLQEQITALETRLNQGNQAAREEAKLDMAYPEWGETLGTPEFKTWMLETGPSEERFNNMKLLEQTDQAKADELVNEWVREFPQWWADRGASIFSTKAKDSIKLIDSYTEKLKAEDPVEVERLKKEANEKRLAGAITPKTAGGSRTTTIPDEEGMKIGFNRIMKKNTF